MEADPEEVEALALQAARESFRRRYPPSMPLTVRFLASISPAGSLACEHLQLPPPPPLLLLLLLLPARC